MTKQMNIRIDNAIYSKLRKHAESKECSMTNVLVDYIKGLKALKGTDKVEAYIEKCEQLTNDEEDFVFKGIIGTLYHLSLLKLCEVDKSDFQTESDFKKLRQAFNLFWDLDPMSKERFDVIFFFEDYCNVELTDKDMEIYCESLEDTITIESFRRNYNEFYKMKRRQHGVKHPAAITKTQLIKDLAGKGVTIFIRKIDGRKIEFLKMN